MSQIPCFYINLDRSPERRVFSEEQFARIGITATRIPAVDGKNLPDGIRDRLTARAATHWRMSNGEIACSLSHISIWERMVNEEIPLAAILEDDVLLSPDIKQLLDDPSWIPVGVDCVKIDTSTLRAFHTDFQSTSIDGFRLSRPITDLRSTGAYIITRTRAAHLLRQAQVIGGPVDVQMFTVIDPAFINPDYRQLHPAVATQSLDEGDRSFLPDAGAESTINNTETKTYKRLRFGPQKVVRELYRPFKRPVQKLHKLLQIPYYRLRYGAAYENVSFSLAGQDSNANSATRT